MVTVTIDRPEVRNAVDPATADLLRAAFERFESDDSLSVAVLTGANRTFCAGFDLNALAGGESYRVNLAGDGPMGPTRMQLAKPVIAAIEGYAVGGGMELALWCDLRVCARDATLGMFNRRFGVPTIDVGTVRLPRMIGQGRALDLLLTGRAVSASEALQIGLVARIVEAGHALREAQALAADLAKFPQAAMRADRRSVLQQWALSIDEAADAEYRGGDQVIASGEAREGARRFAEGSGRHGK